MKYYFVLKRGAILCKYLQNFQTVKPVKQQDVIKDRKPLSGSVL